MSLKKTAGLPRSCRNLLAANYLQTGGGGERTLLPSTIGPYIKMATY